MQHPDKRINFGINQDPPRIPPVDTSPYARVNTVTPHDLELISSVRERIPGTDTIRVKTYYHYHPGLILKDGESCRVIEHGQSGGKEWEISRKVIQISDTQ